MLCAVMVLSDNITLNYSLAPWACQETTESPQQSPIAGASLLMADLAIHLKNENRTMITVFL